MAQTYLSFFSGIGGLEHPSYPPLLFCEKDSSCQHVLQIAHPEVPIVGDIRSLQAPPPADFVVGGWPCQDISQAGKLGGIHAERSGLYFDMLRAAVAAGAHTLIGENVPNLLTINEGNDFQVVLETLTEAGYPHISWRILNARHFGLPQQRRRLFIVASRYQERAESLHAPIPSRETRAASCDVCAFYWTGGKRSICFSRGYAPALKIGATDNKGRAPVAIMIGSQIRKLNSHECLRLQGFDNLNRQHPGISESTLLRMAGNAVPRPMGHFVVEAVTSAAASDGLRTAFGVMTESGLYDNGFIWSIGHREYPLADNLCDFLDSDVSDTLSSQAAAGLLARSIRAKQPMPLQLYELLWKLAIARTGKLKPSRSNSFDILESLSGEIAEYLSSLKPIEEYDTSEEDDL